MSNTTHSFRKSTPQVKRPLNILQVSTADIGGGAEKVAWDLFRAYSAHGYNSWLAVGNKKNRSEPNVLWLDSDRCRSPWARFWLSLQQKQKNSFWGSRLDWIAEPGRRLKVRQGIEDFEFPITWDLLKLPPKRPDIIHCHNLHTGYFDLRALSRLSRRIPVVLTVHDEWLLSGHCAYTLQCDRWRIGCGNCPDLRIYPPIARDATAYNWRRKKRIFSESRIRVSVPCRWLLDELNQSILAAGIVESRLIPYGVDLSVFHPNRQSARADLQIADYTKVLLFTANRVRRHQFKDYVTVRAAIEQVSNRLKGDDVLFIALGENSAPEKIGRARVRFIPYEANTTKVAKYFQAADVYVHAAKADTFPKAILEALCCGIPVVATAVGGIPEQIKGLRSAIPEASWNSFDSSQATGILVDRGDFAVMAFAIGRILSDKRLQSTLANNAAKDGRQRFDLNREAREYLKWYESLIAERRQSEDGPDRHNIKDERLTG